MHTCILDGTKIADRQALHSALSASLSFPGWYGKNLDALYDCLTDIREETEILLLCENAFREHLGSYADLFIKVMGKAAADNPFIRWEILSEKDT